MPRCECGKETKTKYNKSCSRKCWAKYHSKAMMGRKAKIASHWKGGVMYTMGYKWLYKPEHPNASFNRVYIAEHRLIMSQYLGRPLLSSEIVHHINGDTLDNRIDNLVLVNKGQHNTIHMSNPSVQRRIKMRELADSHRDSKTGRFI